MSTQSQNGVVSLSIHTGRVFSATACLGVIQTVDGNTIANIARANLGKMGCSTPTQNNPTPLQVL
jgi:hypothetical protein